MDDNRDKEMMRNYTIAVILMVVVFVAWTRFAPAPRRPAPATPPAQTTESVPSPKAPAAELQPRGEREAEEAPAPPWLPEPAVVADPAAEEVTLANDSLELVFTRIGARLKQARVLINKGSGASVQLVPEQAEADPDAVYPLGLYFTDEALGTRLNVRRWDVAEDPSGRTATFTLTLPGKAVLRKHFTLADTGHVLQVAVDYENLDPAQPQVLGMDQTPAYYLAWAPNVSSGEAAKMAIKQSVVWRKDGAIETLETGKFAPGRDGAAFASVIQNPEWVAVRSAYFVVALAPEFENTQAWVTGAPKQFRVGLAAPRVEVAPAATAANQFAVYIGPSEQRALSQAWSTLPGVLRFFSPRWNFMDWFAKLLLKILNGFYSVIPNYGLAIIFLTILVRVAMYPLTLKSMKSMKKMQMLGPEMEQLKQKYGEDQQELNKRMMELYRERGVNPLGGCLPMMLQMPIFIALYRMLWCAYELRGAPFALWITDLSQPDQLFHLPWMKGLPFVGMFEYLNVLPILMGVAMVLSQKVMPTSGPATNPQQKMMMTFMPVFFSFICYSMASGLNLYILTSTVLGMVQQKFTHVGEVELKQKKTVGKRQHFYTAAQARKRQFEREMKKERKQKRAPRSGDLP